MTSLFSDLYRYRQRKSRSPLEDYLTECLAAVLRVLPGAQLKRFFEELVGEDLGADADKIAELQDAGRIEFITQIFDDRGKRPDLVMYVDGTPTYVFENKVGHHISHETIKDDEGAIRATRSQLHGYAQWIRRAFDAAESDNEKPEPKAKLGKPRLFFVTHFTPVPDDFETVSLDGNCDYSGVYRAHTTWGKVGRLLDKVTIELGARDVARTMAKTFYKFLEDEDMTSEFPGSRDFASLELYLYSGNNFQNLLTKIWRGFYGVLKHGKSGYEVWNIGSEKGILAYERKIQGNNPFPFGTIAQAGIWYPSINSEWAKSGLSDSKEKEFDKIVTSAFGPQIYFTIWADKVNRLSKFWQDQVPNQHWFRPNGNFLTFVPLSQFSTDSEKRADEITNWVKSRRDDLEVILKNCQRSIE